MPRLSNSRLTDTLIRNLRAKENRYEVFDALLPGFGIRISTSGTKSFIVFGREGTRRTRATLGQYPILSLSEAREAAQAALKAMHQGTYHLDRQVTSYDAVLKDWYKRDQKSKKSFREVERAMAAYVSPKLKGKDLRRVERKELIRIIDAVADKGTQTQAARLRSYISRLFSWSTERGLLDTNPALNLPKVFKEISRDRVLSRDELIKIWHASELITRQFRVIIRLLILTGQRKSEITGMKWSEINFSEGIWVLPSERSKNGKPHIVHLCTLSLKELQRIPRSGELVFSTTGSTPVSGFSNVKKKLDETSSVFNWRLHDLRRTFATMSTETLRLDPHIVDLVLNHQAGTLTGVAKIYQRGSYLEERKEVLTQWDEYIKDLTKFEY